MSQNKESTKIVLINGKKRSGKNYFSNILKQELEKRNLTVQIHAFADPIKEIIAKTFHISLDRLDKLKNEEADLGIVHYGYDVDSMERLSNFRLVLQRFGTEAMQSTFGKNVWVDLLLKKAKNVDVVLVPDFRFKSENISQYTIKINNESSLDSHRSENDLNDFKFMYEVDNYGYKDISNDVKQIADDLVLKFLKLE